MSVVDPVFGCVLSSGRLDRDGYCFHGKTRAHIVAWVEANGPVPVDKDGKPLVLDHLCRRRNCKAPHHLEPVTQSENERRKSFRYRMKLKKCPRGHDLTITRVMLPPPFGGQVCRTCNEEAKGHTT